MTEAWEKLKKSVNYYNKEEFISRRDIRNTISDLLDEGNKLQYHADWVRRLENFDSINFHQQSMALGMSVAEFRELKDKARKWDEVKPLLSKELIHDLNLVRVDQPSTEEAT